MVPNFFYIAQGKIHLREPNGSTRVIDSKFGQSLSDRANQIRQRNAWKTQGTGAKFISGGTLWGGQGEEQAQIPVVINAITRGIGDGEILYSLATNEIGGVFSLNYVSGDEQRLVHTSDFRITQLCANSTENKIACVIRNGPNSYIALMRSDGAEITELTQGDSLDSSPVWRSGSDSELVFQSAGLARNPAGFVVGTAPSQIMALETATGKSEVLLGDEKHGYFCPKLDGSGNIYCIRKPYSSPQGSFNPFRAALDLILLPFHLFIAFFQYINFFAMRYSGKTLISSGNVRQKQGDLRHMMIMDNLMQATHFARDFGINDQWKVSKAWTLIRKTKAGQIEEVEKGVLSYDLCEDGSLLLCDGSRIFLRHPDGTRQELAKDQFISQVLAMPHAEAAVKA